MNNDNLPDIFLTANLGESKLYLNKGNLKFEDITAKTGIKSKRGWRTGVTMADVNADGLLDIYIGNSGDIKGANRENELYINKGNLTFEEKAKQYGLNDPGFTTHVSFFDYDLDGDLDCYILNNSFVDVRKFDIEAVRKVRDSLGGHKLLQNNNGHFTDVSEKAGIAGIKIAYGLGVSVSDVNGDMYPDIYISNDFYEKDYLYINQRNGTFKDELPDRIGHISSSSMGADVADINNDGYMDIVTTDMLPEDEYRQRTMTRFEEYNIENMKFRSTFHYQLVQNTLQLNNGDGTFKETAFLSGMAATDWSWGALFFDFDNDEWNDIFISNGIYRDISFMDFSEFLANKANVDKVVSKKGRFDFRDFLPYIPSKKLSNYAYVNQHDLTFKNKSYELGLGKPSFSNGVAYGDLDNDGDLDLVVNNINDVCSVYRNEAAKKTGNHFLTILLEGKVPNKFGVGAWVNLYTNGIKQVRQLFPVRSFQSCMDPKLVFGMGKNSKADSLEIIWPDLSKQTLYNIAADTRLTLRQSDANQKYAPPQPIKKTFFTDNSYRLQGNAMHKENDFVDFDVERLLPHMLSKEGPRLAVGDVNGDRKQDFFVGGASGDEGKLFIQQAAGNFVQSAQDVFVKDKEFEDVAQVFFDIDNDKDLDLLVASGGYQYDAGSSLLQARLYMNDGKAHFTEGQSLSFVSDNSSCIAIEDIDKDGFTDVFIGGRGVSGNYGKPGRSYLLHNERGKLTDITPEMLKAPGMVTDACWTDINNDNYPDLMLVGEWMPVTFFLNEKGKLSAKHEIANSAGWWNVIRQADLDKDGDMDFILGNWGLNSRFKASKEQPMQLYINDFDANGTSECLITYFWPDGKSHLYPTKTDITSQIPSLKKAFLKYQDYAGKSIEDVFGKDEVSGSQQYKTEELRSSILWNQGKAGMQLKALPVTAQVAPVYAIATADFDKDGRTDILLSGNMLDLKPDIGRLDANNGIVLKGDGKGDFIPVSKIETGMYIKGQVRDAEIIKTDNNGQALILARNNDKLMYFKVQ
ncbi:MAG: VCBS repeat-containing protein [Segetibacter sp.]